MKVSRIADAATAAALETAWLYRALEPGSAFGRRAFEEMMPFAPGAEREAQARAAEVIRISRGWAPERISAMRDALRACPDPLPAISRAAMGETLEDAHLLEILRFLDCGQRVEDTAAFGAQLGALAAELETGRAGTFGFYLSDAFDSALANARAEAERAQAHFEAARARVAQRAGTALEREGLGGAEFIVMRDTVQSLPPHVRVVREAPTYYLCELDLDETALAALARRDEAAAASAGCERRVRERLSAAVRAALPQLHALLSSLAQADVDLAQAHFTQRYACVAPVIEARPRIAFEGGSLLPLQAELIAQGRSYEPISVDVSEPAVITGPNMGGKSAALRTCGFIALLAAFGIPVPARAARCALFDDIAWLGAASAESSETRLLSSFASEIVRLNELLARPRVRPLLLVDEFARTTTPHEGSALLISLLRTLRARGRLAFAATHLAQVASHAQVPHYAVRGLRELPASPANDLASALDALALAMDYSVFEVRGGDEAKSDAIALAQLLGLDEEIVAGAKEQSWIR
ncbi:MAG: hypothetical protein ABR508_10265 [Candidatus Baltobacteraceae bacterium]